MFFDDSGELELFTTFSSLGLQFFSEDDFFVQVKVKKDNRREKRARHQFGGSQTLLWSSCTSFDSEDSKIVDSEVTLLLGSFN